ncbi:hypothetical protein DFH09DRAFT_193770 [Mycena vulgaris]|nr:hypothetical protein DFH09DRAFT_193770 [Mycena vulgaris]
MSNLFQDLDGTRNEVTHAQYTTQISHRRSDVLSKARIAISDLVPNEILLLEASLSLFLAIWLRLQADCLDIANWIQNNRVSYLNLKLHFLKRSAGTSCLHFRLSKWWILHILSSRQLPR